MEQPKFILEGGTKVVVHEKIERVPGVMGLTARKAGASGEIISAVGGYGGDCYHVRHDDGSIGMYSFDEFELGGPAAAGAVDP